jgi:peptide deformylase
MTVLRRTQFGNPILRQIARNLTISEIKSRSFQALIKNLYATLDCKKLGVGLAAPQVGEPKALAVIHIQKTELRPEFRLTIINPEIINTFGRRTQLWEGCISSGTDQAALFAKVPRYKKLELNYWDENGKEQRQIFEGLKAHIIQHEVDHLNGILFVDRVKDTKSYTTFSEYKKLLKQQKGRS